MRRGGEPQSTRQSSDDHSPTQLWRIGSGENPVYPTYSDEDCYLSAGTDGSLGVPTMRLKTYPRREDRSWWKPFQARTGEVEHASPLERQLDHFDQC